MPSIQGRTREQLRQHIGRTLGAVHISAVASNGNTTSFSTDTLVLGGADNYIGSWVRFTSGDDDGETRRVTESDISSNVPTITFMPALSAITSSGDGYELW